MWSQGRALETMKSNQRRRFNEGSFWPKRWPGRGPIFRQRSRAAIIQSSVTSATMNESEDCGDGCAESGAAVACCCSGDGNRRCAAWKSSRQWSRSYHRLPSNIFFRTTVARSRAP